VSLVVVATACLVFGLNMLLGVLRLPRVLHPWVLGVLPFVVGGIVSVPQVMAAYRQTQRPWHD